MGVYCDGTAGPKPEIKEEKIKRPMRDKLEITEKLKVGEKNTTSRANFTNNTEI